MEMEREDEHQRQQLTEKQTQNQKEEGGTLEFETARSTREGM